jgi:hypothetical protein
LVTAGALAVAAERRERLIVRDAFLPSVEGNPRMPRTECLIVALLIASACSVGWAACPFCPPSGPTRSEQIAQADLAVLARWERLIEPRGELEGADPQTVFRVVEVLRTSGRPLKAGEKITVNTLQEGKPGQLFVLLASATEGLPDWHSLFEVTLDAYQYLKQAPSLEEPAVKRLRYFLKFLEVGDTFIANDAFAEFSVARYQDVAQLAPYLSREKLRRWLADDSDSTQVRHGFYGLLLGLCGNEDDARYLAGRVLPPPASDRPRLGLDGLMAGYVLLTGERGVRELVAAKIQVPSRIDGEVSAVMGALRFLWEYVPERVPRGEVVAAMRLLVDDTRHGELAVIDLARWKDWDSLPRVIAVYGQPPFETREGKEKLVQFVLVAQKDLSATADEPRLMQARSFLQRLRREEPDVVRAAEKWLAPARGRSTSAQSPLEGNLDDRSASSPGRHP